MHSLSEAEREFIEGGASQGIRSDGRAMLDVRPVTLETNVLPNASGSARVRIGGVTDILVGVKAEVAEPPLDRPEHGIISFTVECSSLASPDFVGRGAADLNAELAQLLTRLYSSQATNALRRALCLIVGKKCWVLHVDALVLDSGGNLFGALSLAVRAALRVVLLPRVIVVEGEADEDDDIEVDEEEFNVISHAEDAPLAVTLSTLGNRNGLYMADCTSDEETCANFALTVGVSPSGSSCGVVSAGSKGVDVDTLGKMLRDAVTLGVDMLKKTNDFLQEDVRKRLMSDAADGAIGLFT